MEMGKSSEDHFGTESNLVDKILKQLPVQKCDSVIVSRMPLQIIGRSTMFFNDAGHLISLMENEEFVLTLSSMSCLILGSINPWGHMINSNMYNFKITRWPQSNLKNELQVVKSDNFAATASLIDYVGELPGTPIKNMKKHFLFVSPTIDHGLLKNKSYNFNVHVISPTDAGLISVLNQDALIHNFYVLPR